MSLHHNPRVAVTPAQMAWLGELGIDPKLLASLAETETVFASPVAAVDASTPEAEVVAKGAEASGVADSPAAVAPNQPVTRPVSFQAIDVSTQDLTSLAEMVASCQACGLHAVRHKTVFGDGALDAPDWMVIGEVPGDHDDHSGLPFQGQAGELLGTMLGAAQILPKARVFYTNLLKCRPKGARPPRPDEIESCLPYLQRQIALVRPAGLLVLGWQAAQAVITERASLDQLRGRVHRYQKGGMDIPVVVMHHPGSLMVRGHFKAAAWQDLQLAHSLMATPAR